MEAAAVGRQIVWGAPVYDQVRVGFIEAKKAIGNVGKENTTHLEITFPSTGGRILFRSLDDPDNVRGHTADGVVIDEAAMVNPSAWHDVLRPMLMDTQGWAWLISCVTADTLLTTSRGFIQIGDLSAERERGTWVELSDMDVAGFADSHQAASHFYVSGMSPTRKILTGAGYELECTPHHPLWVIRKGGNGLAGWVRVGELRPGDHVAMRRDADLWGTDDSLLDDEAYLMGLIIGDGNIYWPTYSITIACSEQETQTHRFLGRMGFKHYGKYHWQFNSKEFCQHLKNYGFTKATARFKSIPPGILKSSKRVIAQFLSGLFDADGTTHGSRGNVGFTTTSEKLARDLQTVLLNFGIVARRHPYEAKPTKRVKVFSKGFTLALSLKDSLLFYDRIGFHLDRKQARRLLAANTSTARHWSDDGVPDQGRRINRLRRSIGGKGKPGNYTYNLDYCQKAKQVGYPKLREALVRLAAAKLVADLVILRKLEAERYFWDEIRVIAESENETFDLHVPVNHVYSGNGFICHNTPRGTNWFRKEFELFDEMPDGRAWQIPTLGCTVTDSGLERTPHPLENTDIQFDEIQRLFKQMPLETFRQEILAEFLQGEGAVFRNITACLLKETVGVPGLHTGHHKVAGVDWGQRHDFTAISVLCVTCHMECEMVRYNRVEWEFLSGQVRRLISKWQIQDVLVEYNSIGGPNFETLAKDRLPVRAFLTTSASKPPLIQSLRLALEQETFLWLNVPWATAELQAYESKVAANNRIVYSAPHGMHDDSVLARCLALHAASTLRSIRFS